MKFSRFVLVSLAAVVALGGCGKSGVPTASAPISEPTLDTTPPPVPEALSVSQETGSGTDVLQWSPSAAPDLSMYEVFIYRPDPARDNSFVLMDETVGPYNHYRLQPVGEATTRYFRVRSVDESGNRSALSETIAVEQHPFRPVGEPDPPDEKPPLGHMDP